MMTNPTFALSIFTQRRINTRAVPPALVREAESGSTRPGFTPTAEEANSIAALRRRDPEALDRFVRDQTQRIYSVIVRLVRDPVEAKDLVQETFLQALGSLDSFRGHAKAATWLYSIAMNVTRNHLSKKVKLRRVLREQEIDWIQPRFTERGEHVDHFSDWDPDIMMQKRERVRLVREAIDRLPASYREVLTLRDLQELSTAEVAEVLSLSEGNVRVRLHRARNALRELIAPHFAIPPSSACS